MLPQFDNDRLLLVSMYLMLEFASFQANQSVGKCVLLFLFYVFTRNFDQIAQRHNGPADNEVELLFFFFGTAMAESYVFQTDSFRYRLSDLDLFPMLSTRWNCTSGKKIARGIPGNPPPVPISITVEPFLNFII